MTKSKKNLAMVNILLNRNLTADNFAARLTQSNLASKNYIADFVREEDFDQKLKKNHKKFFSNKTKYLQAKKDLNNLSEKFKLLSYNFLPQCLIH